MRNILIAGVGGQGTVLAAKVLAQAAQAKGWQVRTAETIGMAQRGGNVTSHVRMGDQGEEIYSPLLMPQTADLLIAFEPGEVLRNLLYLSSQGVAVVARSVVQPVTAALSDAPYEANTLEDALRSALGQRLRMVDDEDVLRQVGNRKALNTVLLTCAVLTGSLPLDVEDLRQAFEACVKSRFVPLNLEAVDAAASYWSATHQ